METILATAFGRVINFQRGESDLLFEAASGMFELLHETSKTSVSHLIMILSKLNLFVIAVLSVVVCAGNFPWLEPMFRFMLRGSKIEKYYTYMHETAFVLIQERRKEKEPGKVCKLKLPLMYIPMNN